MKKNYSRRKGFFFPTPPINSYKVEKANISDWYKVHRVWKVDCYYPWVLKDAQRKSDAVCFQGHLRSQGTCWRGGILLTPVAWPSISLYFTGRTVKPLYYNISLNGESSFDLGKIVLRKVKTMPQQWRKWGILKITRQERKLQKHKLFFFSRPVCTSLPWLDIV